MKTVAKETIIEFEEKKSRFIGYIKPVSTVIEAEKFIDSIKNASKRNSQCAALQSNGKWAGIF